MEQIFALKRVDIGKCKLNKTYCLKEGYHTNYVAREADFLFSLNESICEMFGSLWKRETQTLILLLLDKSEGRLSW